MGSPHDHELPATPAAHMILSYAEVEYLTQGLDDYLLEEHRTWTPEKADHIAALDTVLGKVTRLRRALLLGGQASAVITGADAPPDAPAGPHGAQG